MRQPLRPEPARDIQTAGTAEPDEPAVDPDTADPVELPISEELDLHAFAPRDVAALVEHYLDEARAAGFASVRIIHGRGTGTQRAIVRALLARHPAVEGFADAPPDLGGWGATLVRLRAL